MKNLVSTILVVTLLGIAPGVLSQQHSQQMTTARAAKTLSYDVAIDARTFRIHDDINPFASNPPAISRGNAFFVNGKIYPGGTIPAGENVFSPDNDGSLGNWICRGIFLVNFADIVAGAPIHVDTTQLFRFDDGAALVTEGLEGAVPTLRALTGGMGDFSGASGEVHQELLGTNTTGMFNIRLTFEIKKKSIN